MDLSVKFDNQAQRDFYFSTARNQAFSGGFNNGKTWAGCLKAFTLLTTFPNYRMAINRQTYKDLKITTMQSFFKICPRELIARHNEQDGYTELINKSAIYWLHLDNVDDNTLRGLEVNSILNDQAEEISEKVYDVLDARIGRWDNAEIPDELLKFAGSWPSKNGKLIAPSYHMLLCNPDTQYHFIYRKYHPDSLERRDNYFFVEGQWSESLGSTETYQEALKHDAEWVAKFVRGQWGLSSAQIHRLDPSSILEPSEDLLERIKTKGNLFRVLDHGDASPTSCLWFAAIDGIYICYREYYLPNTVISQHRRNISELSGTEKFSGNYADPQIFKKTAQKNGGFWTVADEYLEGADYPLAWLPADNNEFATRNRVNELLRTSPTRRHPINKEPNAPGLYFIKRTSDYQQGCYHTINELQSQRRKLLGYVDGKAIYCDEREESVADHAYDCVRYFVAAHGSPNSVPSKAPPRFSFKFYKMMNQRNQQLTSAA